MLTLLRHAFASLKRAPQHSLITVVLLAIGIGAVTAVASLARAVFVDAVPFRDAGRVVQITTASADYASNNLPVSWKVSEDMRREVQGLEGLALTRYLAVALGGSEFPEQIEVSRVSANLAQVIGVDLAGSGFSAAAADGAPEIVISARLRERLFPDRDPVGASLIIDGTPRTVVGVMPAGLRYPTADTEAWVPLVPSEFERERRGLSFLRAVGRLEPGVTVEQLNERLAAFMREQGRLYPNEVSGLSAVAVPVPEVVVGPLRPLLLMLLTAVGCVLLLALVNVAGLMLMRLARRSQEFAVRSALGGAHGALTRLLAVEGLLVGGVAALLGLALAAGALRLIQALAVRQLPPGIELGVEPFSFLVAAGLGLAVAASFALLTPDGEFDGALAQVLREGRRSVGGSRARRRAFDVLIVGEVALAFVLLAAAGLALRSFARVADLDLGFRSNGVQLIGLSPNAVPLADLPRYLTALTEHTATMPEARSAAVLHRAVITVRNASTQYRVEGEAPPETLPAADFRMFTPAALGMLGVPLIEGRGFAASDRADSAPVILISRQFADRHWPGKSALGGRVDLGDNIFRTVVGVVGDVRMRGVEEAPQPTVYAPIAQAPLLNGLRQIFLAVDSALSPAELQQRLRAHLKGFDASLPINLPVPLEETRHQALGPRRIAMSLFGAFAAIAVLLAVAGVYAVLGYRIEQRRPEIAVRLALGADRSRVFNQVVREALLLAGVGLAVGALAALASGKLLAGIVYGISPFDPLTYGVALLVIALAALAAASVPALRAALVAPNTVLRAAE
jgi:putative ABC transport system permease protein